MSRMSVLMTIAISLSLALGQSAVGQTTDKDKVAQEIKDLRNKWIAAEEAKNISYLDQLMTDDFVAGNAQGQVLKKPEYLESQRRPDRTLKVSPGRDTLVRLYGNVAILTENVTVDGQDKGRPFGGEFRFVRIFAKQEGKWRAVLGQGTPLVAQTVSAK
jgi:ketosteroid isomerase-like protein